MSRPSRKAGDVGSARAQGKWVVLPVSDNNSVAPGFISLVVLEAESVSAKRCKEGSANLQNAALFNPEVRTARNGGIGNQDNDMPRAFQKKKQHE